jgi:hypothetical protein
LSDRPYNQKATHPLPGQAAGALLWSVFFVIAPTEILFFGAPVWIPLLIWRERVRAARYGFFPAVIGRFAVIRAIIMTAVLLPTKHEDGRVGPFSLTNIALGDLVAEGFIYPLFDERHNVLRLTLPSTAPTRREVMQAIREQTGFRASVFHCGNNATLLFGSGGGLIKVSDR